MSILSTCMKAYILPSANVNYDSILCHFRDKAKYWSKIAYFTARRVCIGRAMLWQDIDRSVCLSVTRWNFVETAKRLLNPFSPQRSHAIYLFCNKRYHNTATRNGQTGTSNIRGYQKNAIFKQYYV